MFVQRVCLRRWRRGRWSRGGKCCKVGADNPGVTRDLPSERSKVLGFVDLHVEELVFIGTSGRNLFQSKCKFMDSLVRESFNCSPCVSLCQRIGGGMKCIGFLCC